MAKTLSAHEHQVNKVFSSDFQLSIPGYQRPYRWGTDQALQLLDDLEDGMDRSDEDPYFLGSLVLVESGGNEYEVIDGQQRLTTLTILFAVLRDLAGPEIAAELDDFVRERGKKLQGFGARPRLSLRRQDQEFFGTYVQERGRIAELLLLSDNEARTEPQRAIRDNAAAFSSRVSAWSLERRDALAEFASARTYLVVVTTADLDSAYRIFSVMNARGLDLTPADIFKSQVTGALPDDAPEVKDWEDLEESLGSDDFSDLFRDIRTIVSGERARRELLKEFPAQVLDQYLARGPEGRAEFVSSVLKPYGKAFLRVNSRGFGGSEWEPVNSWLKRLVALDNADWRPAALWALRHHADDPRFLDSFLRRLERLAASMLLRGTYTTPRVARYIDLINQLKSGEGLEATAFHLDDDEVKATVDALGGDVYRMQSRRARYLLLRLDELMANDPGVTYSHAVLSLEHVLPQHPREGSLWREAFSDEQRTQWVHKLGNLVLLNRQKNSQAGNLDFADKKSRYFLGRGGAATFAVTTEVLHHQEWTPEVLERIQVSRVRVLAHEWRLELDGRS